MVDYKFTFNKYIETFAVIDGYANYQVSNFGNVINTKTNRILKQFSNIAGYKTVRIINTKGTKTFYVHRLVAMAFLNNTDNKKMVDHIDNNGLNNNIENLRFATSKENNANSKKMQNTSSIYKGVYWHKKGKKWCVKIKNNGVEEYLGLFDDEIKGGKKYDEYAKKYFGEYAKLNY
jgi:hypothetical protein